MVQKVLGYPGKFPDNLESFSEQQIPGQVKKSKFGLNIIWMIFLFRNKHYVIALFDLEWPTFLPNKWILYDEPRLQIVH